MSSRNRTKQVIYRSVWNEGIVDTIATLDLTSGEVFDIAVSEDEETAEYEFHEKDVIIDTQTGEQADIIEDENGYRYSIDKEDIEIFYH